MMRSISLGMGLLLQSIAIAAAPQISIPTSSPSPTNSDCTLLFLTDKESFHEDHWDCEPVCSTIETSRLGIDATVTDYPAWLTSMNQQYSTSGMPWSGSTVFVHTSLYTYPGGSFTGYGVYDSHALTRAGYDIVTEIISSVSCPPTTTATLPPSPTGSVCSPHGDHWHCDEPTQTPQDPGDDTECTPHGDHWHCPSGVPEPTTPPPTTGSSTTTPTETETCTPHGDHWHCPSGVPEPTTTPYTTGSSTTESSTTETSTTGPPTIDSSTSSLTETEKCTPHGDHWHCPSNVPEPTTPPPTVEPTATGVESSTVSPPIPGSSTVSSSTKTPEETGAIPGDVGDEPEAEPTPGDSQKYSSQTSVSGAPTSAVSTPSTLPPFSEAPDGPQTSSRYILSIVFVASVVTAAGLS